MSQGEERIKKMVQQAAGIVSASEKKVGISKAMELVGFSEEERRQMTLYQQVRRLAMKVSLVVVPLRAAAVNASDDVSSLTPTSESENNQDSSTNTPSVRRCLLPSTPSTDPSSSQKTVKKSRRTSKDVQREASAKAESKLRHKVAMKSATRLINANNELPKDDPKKKSINCIVKQTNETFNSNVSAKTAARYVREGMIGMSPMKRGPVGDLPKIIYEALKVAYATYLKLEQAESKKQSNTKHMSKLVNACVNKAGFNKTRDDLARKLQKDTANQFEVGKANVVEQRRVMWTTAYNLDMWFSTWKDTLIDLGFAREKEASDGDIEGELVFFSGQLERIGNVDETDGSIDDTTGQRGGRPPMTFFAPEVAGGATAVNKSGYSSTIICGSNAAGEPFPPHFQLKSMAQTDEGQRMSVDWFTNSKNIIAKFGHREPKSLPCTFGMNEKAGMNSVELEKYMRCSILPLYPDIADVKGKRVIMKVDSGPGRMNLEMLADLRLQGLYLVPGVPNTTGKTQETDQNYGPFKGSFRANIRTLSQARFDNGLPIRVTDIPLLVFGGKCLSTNVMLDDAFSQAFSVEANLGCWRKCGAVPLTRRPLLCKDVRRELPVGAASASALLSENEEADPEVERLRHLESLNGYYCDLLSTKGYDGSHLRKNAPTRSRFVAVTKPQTQERVMAIKDAKTAGQMFYATGGRHLNSNDFFKAKEIQSRQADIKKMEDVKRDRGKYCTEQKGSIVLIKRKGELTADTEKNFTLPEIKTLLKWKKVKVVSNRKRDMVDAYIAAPKPKIQKVWTRSEENVLQQLKSLDVPLKDTALGVASKQMARAVGNNLAQLDTDSLDALKNAIRDHDDNHRDNVI